MRLCDNIFSLSTSMTRVEKYRRYREEISNMKFETFSQKKEAAEQIQKLHNANSGNKLTLDNVLEVHDVFDGNKKKIKRIQLFPLTKFEILYSLIAIISIAIILVALILTGNKIWG